MVEFEILSSMKKFLYNGSGGYISELVNKPIYKIINLGSVYDEEVFNKYFYNPEQAVLDNRLEGYYLLNNPYEGEHVVKTILSKSEEIDLITDKLMVDK